MTDPATLFDYYAERFTQEASQTSGEQRIRFAAIARTWATAARILRGEE